MQPIPWSEKEKEMFLFLSQHENLGKTKHIPKWIKNLTPFVYPALVVCFFVSTGALVDNIFGFTLNVRMFVVTIGLMSANIALFVLAVFAFQDWLKKTQVAKTALKEECFDKMIFLWGRATGKNYADLFKNPLSRAYVEKMKENFDELLREKDKEQKDNKFLNKIYGTNQDQSPADTFLVSQKDIDRDPASRILNMSPNTKETA